MAGTNALCCVAHFDDNDTGSRFKADVYFGTERAAVDYMDGIKGLYSGRLQILFFSVNTDGKKAATVFRDGILATLTPVQRAAVQMNQ